MRLYCTDLDNTIICGQEPEYFGTCVAIKNNKKASFMTMESYDKFIEIISNIMTLPITTRCEKSYNNIYLKKFFKYALVDNGAILISENAKECEDWIKESRQIISPYKKEFEEIRKLIEFYGYKEKWGSEFVLDYVNKEITEEKKNELQKKLESYGNFLINIGKTSFVCTYNKLSKGENIKRFAQKYGYEIYITTGDNKEDESMFCESVHSFGKNNAKINLKSTDKLDFCNKVINEVYELLTKEKR